MTTTDTNTPVTTASSTYDVVIVGAGFSGTYQLKKLRDLGFSTILFEKSDGLGGVWNLNRYPGARVDSDAEVYQFSDEQLWKDWEWQERFPDHNALRDYFAYVDSKWDLSKDIRFNTKVTGARFDESTNRWTIKTSDGAATTAQFLIFATGSTIEPYTPQFPGIDTYKGRLAHTTLWPEDLDYTDKRVAVIGTGASGVQVIQEIGPVAQHLTVFQRTPNLSLPMQQAVYDSAINDKAKEGYEEMFKFARTAFAGVNFDFDPRSAVEVSDEERERLYEECWQGGGFRFWMATFGDTLGNKDSNNHAYDFWKKKIRAIVTDPVKADLLAPNEAPHPFGTKRPALHQNYYEIMDRDTVELVSVRKSPIETFTEKGIRTTDGIEREFDIIILATGFDNNTATLTSIDIYGTDGRTLREKWATGVDAYLGATTHGYPNLAFLYGPQSPAAFGNGPTTAELQGDELAGLLVHLRDNGFQRFEPTREADKEWTALVNSIDDVSLFRFADSWYNGANIPGKHRQMLQWPGGNSAYLDLWAAEANANYSKGLELK